MLAFNEASEASEQVDQSAQPHIGESPETLAARRFSAAKQKYQSAAPDAAPLPPTVELDAYLATQFAKIRGGDQLAGMLRAQIEQQQRERNEKSTRREAMSAVQRRRDIARDEVANSPLQAADRHHIHSVLALCGLPYRRPNDAQKEFAKEYGRNSLVVQAGYLKDPSSGKMVAQGLPYGPKARIMMLHICTMAVRQNSPQIEVSDSMSAFIRDLGFHVTGGEKGSIGQFKEQLHRLAAAHMTIGLWNGVQASTINAHPIEAFSIWLPRDPDQKTLWTSTVHLNERFFRSLKEHALPIDVRALKPFTNSAKQMDILLWLAYRLRNIRRPYPISWTILREQFGADVKCRDRKFRQSFAEDIQTIQEVFPQLRLKLDERGLTLMPVDLEQVLGAPKRKALLH